MKDGAAGGGAWRTIKELTSTRYAAITKRFNDPNVEERGLVFTPKLPVAQRKQVEADFGRECDTDDRRRPGEARAQRASVLIFVCTRSGVVRSF